MMANSNDKTAKYYDVVSSFTKNDKVTFYENSYIRSIKTLGSTVLDIGCGTGRHAVPLTKMGYRVDGVDNSKEMLKVLAKKNKLIRTFKGNYLDIQIKKKYDLIILMWNALNEICLDNYDLDRFFKKVLGNLNSNGILLINIDDIKNIKLNNLRFEYKIENKDLVYIFKWNVMDFNKKKNITKSKESLKVYKGPNLIDGYQTLITQKWWTLEELEKKAMEFKLILKTVHINLNDELYLLFHRDDK